MITNDSPLPVRLFKIKIIDILIILIALSLTVFSVHAAYIKPHGRINVLLRAQDRESVYYMDNNDDETVLLTGPLGDTTVRIKEGSVWIESSPCDNKTCVATGVISRAGQWAACLPNGVLVIMQGDSAEGDVDAVSW